MSNKVPLGGGTEYSEKKQFWARFFFIGWNKKVTWLNPPGFTTPSYTFSSSSLTPPSTYYKNRPRVSNNIGYDSISYTLKCLDRLCT